MRDENPDDDGVDVLQQQNKMSVHDSKRKVERPNGVENEVADVKYDCIHAWIGEDRPKVVAEVLYVLQEVDEAQEQERLACCNGHERKRPNLFVHRNGPVFN